MKIKICGLTRAEDAKLAHELGAWALGFIFAEKSPRRITANQAEKIIQPDALNIAVFMDQADMAADILKNMPFAGVQLHGSETPDDCKRIKDSFGGLVIKAFRHGLDTADQYAGAVDYVLSDGVAAGKTSDWSSAAAYRGLPLILAGGITAENILAAARKANPFAIDLSSGVEESPGIKDAEKLHYLFKEIRNEP